VYEVHLERAAENDLKRLTTSTFHRIIPQIRALAENPRPLGCRKLTGSKNDWRIRIGDCHPSKSLACLYVKEEDDGENYCYLSQPAVWEY